MAHKKVLASLSRNHKGAGVLVCNDHLSLALQCVYNTGHCAATLPWKPDENMQCGNTLLLTVDSCALAAAPNQHCSCGNAVNQCNSSMAAPTLHHVSRQQSHALRFRGRIYMTNERLFLALAL